MRYDSNRRHHPLLEPLMHKDITPNATIGTMEHIMIKKKSEHNWRRTIGLLNTQCYTVVLYSINYILYNVDKPVLEPFIVIYDHGFHWGRSKFG